MPWMSLPMLPVLKRARVGLLHMESVRQKRGEIFRKGFSGRPMVASWAPWVGSWGPFQLENQLKLARIDGMRLLMFAVIYLHE